MSAKTRFVVTGTIIRKVGGKAEPVDLYIDAEDIQDARWQVNHGAIEMTLTSQFPGATVKYDARTLKKHTQPYK